MTSGCKQAGSRQPASAPSSPSRLFPSHVPPAFPHAQWPRLPSQQDTCDSPPPHSGLRQRHQHDPPFARGETEAPKGHRAQNCASQDFSCILTLYHGSLSLWWPLEMCSWGPAFRPPPPRVPQPLPCTSLPRSGSGLQEHPLKWGTGPPAPFRVVTSVGATHRAASTQAHHQGAGCAWGYLVPLQEASRGEYMGCRWRCGFKQWPPPTTCTTLPSFKWRLCHPRGLPVPTEHGSSFLGDLGHHNKLAGTSLLWSVGAGSPFLLPFNYAAFA